MHIRYQVNGEWFETDTSKSHDISLPLLFNGPQPNAYGVAPATSTPCAAGELVGDTRRGGSCNFEEYRLIPHCNGTHTECAGHITKKRMFVSDCVREAFVPARVISVVSDAAEKSGESYPVDFGNRDRLITRASVEKAVGDGSFCDALIVRTLPNTQAKRSATYLEDVPPYFSTEAMEFIVRLGTRHLLVDLPSIDRLFDDGKLSNHRMFWNIGAGSFELNDESRPKNTVTELIYVQDEVPDGRYLLNLQIAPFATDAAPSRPLIFSV